MQARQAVGTINVRRMFHKSAREFLKRLAVVVRDEGRNFLPKPGAAPDYATLQEAIIAHLPELFKCADGLLEYLVDNSTDDPEAIARLDLASWLEVAAVAFRLNCGEELRKSFDSILAAVGPMLAEHKPRPNTGAAPTSSS